MLSSSSSSDDDEGAARRGPATGFVSSSKPAPATATSTACKGKATTTYLTYGGDSSEDEEDEERELQRRLEAKRLMAAAAARAAAAGGGGSKAPAKASAAAASKPPPPPSASGRRLQQEQQRRAAVDLDDASTADEAEDGYGTGGGARRLPPLAAFKRKLGQGAAAWQSAAVAASDEEDSDATTQGEEEVDVKPGATAARKSAANAAPLARKRPRPQSAASAASSAGASRPRSALSAGSSDESGDNGEDGELYPTIKNPIELGALEPLVLADRHPDDDESDREEEDEEGLAPTQVGAGRGPVAVPAAANRYLQDYQRDGIKWMFKNYKGQQGCVLGDEMGLGKTIQVTCLLLALFRKQGLADADKAALRAHKRLVRDKPARGHCALLVVPRSVLAQWEGELLKWGRFAVTTLEGGADVEQRIEEAARGGFEVALCTYGFIKGRWGEKLWGVRWRVVVFDEFHGCKNKRSETHNAAKALEARIKIGLTGTPIQNNVEELWTLLSIVAPNLAGGEPEFRADYADPIKRGQKRSATGEIVERGRAAQGQLQALLHKVLLQRDKRTIEHKLHGKREFVVFCKLTDIQYDVYRNVLALPEVQLLALRRKPCDCGRKRHGQTRGECCYKIPKVKATGASSPSSSSSSSGAVLSSSVRGGIDPRALIWKRLHPTGEACDKCPNCLTFACLSRLQKVANHPCLLQYNAATAHSSSSSNGGFSAAEDKAYTKDFARLAFGKHAGALGGVEMTGNILELKNIGMKACGKLRALGALLDSFDKREKVLLFSFSTQMLDVLGAFATTMRYEYVRLDGSITGGERKKIIEEFNRDPTKTLFLISTRAGGLGLNLAVACKVIIWDVNWNPSHDLQAMDRAYRLGQVKVVEVYRLVAQGTIEELCYMRQIYKQQLTDYTLDGVTVAPPSSSCWAVAAASSSPSGGRKRGRKKKATTAGVLFDSVQGHKGEEGELFGVENLLQLSRGSILTELRLKAQALAAEEGEGVDAAAACGGGVEEGEGGGAPAPATSKERIARQVKRMAEVAARAREHLRRKRKKRGGGGGGSEDEEEEDGGEGAMPSSSQGFDAELPANEILDLLGAKGEEDEEEDEIEEEDRSEGKEAAQEWSKAAGKGKGKARARPSPPPRRQQHQEEEEEEEEDSEASATPSPTPEAKAGGRPSPSSLPRDGGEKKRNLFTPRYLPKLE